MDLWGHVRLGPLKTVKVFLLVVVLSNQSQVTDFHNHLFGCYRHRRLKLVSDIRVGFLTLDVNQNVLRLQVPMAVVKSVQNGQSLGNLPENDPHLLFF